MKMIKIFLTSVFIGAFSFSAFSQDTLAVKKAVQFVKIEIGDHILRCPVLPACLKPALMKIQGISDYHSDVPADCITFSMPQGVTTAEEITFMATNCAFPKNDVKVIIADKAFDQK
jgi:hypothetical protein